MERPLREEGCWERGWNADLEVIAGEDGRKGVLGNNVILACQGDERSIF